MKIKIFSLTFLFASRVLQIDQTFFSSLLDLGMAMSAVTTRSPRCPLRIWIG